MGLAAAVRSDNGRSAIKVDFISLLSFGIRLERLGNEWLCTFPRSLGAWVSAAAAAPFLARDLRVIAALPSSLSLSRLNPLSFSNSLSVLGTPNMAQNPSSIYWMTLEILNFHTFFHFIVWFV